MQLNPRSWPLFTSTGSAVMDDETADDENPALGWPKNDRPAAPQEGCSSLTSNYTAAWVWGRGQEGSRLRRLSQPVSRKKSACGATSAIGLRCGRFSIINTSDQD